MRKSTSVTIDVHFEGFIAAKIKEGRFSSTSEVVRAGLSLLEEQETKLATLRAALIEGEESGAAEKFDIKEFLTSVKANKKSKK